MKINGKDNYLVTHVLQNISENEKPFGMTQGRVNADHLDFWMNCPFNEQQFCS